MSRFIFKILRLLVNIPRPMRDWTDDIHIYVGIPNDMIINSVR